MFRLQQRRLRVKKIALDGQEFDLSRPTKKHERRARKL